MSPQIASLRWRIVASIALVWHCVLVISCFIVRSFFIEIVSSGLKMLKVFIRHTCCWLEQVRGKGKHLTATLLSEYWPFILMTNITLCLRLKGKVNFYKLHSNPTKLTILSLRLKLVSSIRGCSHNQGFLNPPPSAIWLTPRPPSSAFVSICPKPLSYYNFLRRLVYIRK